MISKVSPDNKRGSSQQLQLEMMSSWICTCSWQICAMEERSSLNLWAAGAGKTQIPKDAHPFEFTALSFDHDSGSH
jgi:hypothetical protein